MSEELIDVLTVEGEPTGACKTKAAIHRDGDWHRAAHVWIVGSDGRVLLQRRSLEKENWPGLWDVSVAGHVSAGESAKEAVIREASEELGLELSASELVPLTIVRASRVLRDGRYIDNELHEVFLLRRDVDLSTLTLQRGEVDGAVWASVAELQTRGDLVPHAEEYAALTAALA